MTAPATRFVPPSTLLDVRFVAEDGRLSFVVRASDPASPTHARFPLAVDVGPPDAPTALLSAAPAVWIPRQDEHAREAHRRLDTVRVELGVPSIGPTYVLMFARPTDDRSRWHGYDWVALRDDTPLHEVVVFPEYGSTPFGPDDWDWQDGWWYPYSTYRACPAR